MDARFMLELAAAHLDLAELHAVGDRRDRAADHLGRVFSACRVAAIVAGLDEVHLHAGAARDAGLPAVEQSGKMGNS